ncbi:MAG: hypothetical protein KBT27_04085 [Prevotellaceae bacterium]|nr:hypothetical protein [Candidatus Faecinaster equi]
MAYKIPDTPVSSSTIYELADYLEFLCLLNGSEYSIVNAMRQIDYISDEVDDNQEIEDNDLFDNLQDALSEIDRRSNACRGNYPFDTSQNGIKLKECDQKIKLIYIFLLLSTRLNMIDNKFIDSIDGTALFEQLSSIVAGEYFGNRSKNKVFGTGVSGGFREKVIDLIKEIGEGDDYYDPEYSTHDEKDGGVDVVVWKPFSDKYKGKLIGLGQCKTGTSWRNEIGRLDPEIFCASYLKRQPISKPVGMFFVAEIFQKNLETSSRKAGILFDRCRIMDYLPEIERIPQDLLENIRHWVDGSMNKVRDAYSA